MAAPAPTYGPDSELVRTAGAACDPCVFVWVQRQGTGRVRSNVTTQGVFIDCGTVCQADFADWVDYITLTAEPAASFRGWERTAEATCPDPQGNICRIPMSGTFVCVKAVFATGTDIVGSCPPPGQPQPPPGPQTPPPPPPCVSCPPPPLRTRCTIDGTPLSDVIQGTSGGDVICGHGGNDTIYGGTGNDLLKGGVGNDKLYGQSHRDRLAGEGGADMLNGGAAADDYLGGAGNDVIVARDRVRDTVHGGPGRDRARVDLSDLVRAIERRF
jgi:RTX calcium-binding nonapeptide repeat (4 copies)